jgi:hypothetical protein
MLTFFGARSLPARVLLRTNGFAYCGVDLQLMSEHFELVLTVLIRS